MHRLVLLAWLVLIAGMSAAAAEPVADFYRGRTVSFLVGYGPGTGYDVYARLLIRHMARHIPGNPNLVPENMPGAGSMVMINHLYNVALRDGSVIGMPARNLVTEPLFGNSQAKFDGTKFTWIGSMTREVSLCFTWHEAGLTTLDDAKKREVLVGATGLASDSYIDPQLLNAVLGTRFKVILGYPDSASIGLAMERHELDGYCSFTYGSVKSARPQWLDQHLITILAQLTVAKSPELPTVPLIMDLTKDEAAKQAFELVFANQEMGRPVAGPPGMPKERLAALRTAFDETMTDPQFRDDAARSRIDIDAISGAAIDDLMRRMYETPRSVIDKVMAIRPKDETSK
jgi:tripartite-type tricarboxylate transporter receptor subunit TctC